MVEDSVEDLVDDMVANLVGKEVGKVRKEEEVVAGECESQIRRHLLVVVCLLYLKSPGPGS